MDKNASLPLAPLGPLAQLSAGRLPERLVRLLFGLWLYGLSVALMVEGAVGASPWDVFHVGAARHLPLSLGMVMVLASLLVLRSEEHTSELQSRENLVCRLLLEKKNRLS